jgi:hypothetical protein
MNAVCAVVALLVGALLCTAAASGQQMSTNGDAKECAKRSAIATSLATIESAYAAAKSTEQRAALSAQIVDIKKHISELQPVMYGGCPDDLGIAALSGREERVHAAINQAVETERRRLETEAARRREEIDAARRRQETIAATERRRQEISAKQWPETIKQAVLARRVQIGMTTEQVTASLGQPDRINETITATTREEQWVYPGLTYLYFTNGTLTTIGRSR